MILEITMRPRGAILKLPLNYQQVLQAMIYNNLDDAMAKFIHDEGFKYEGRSFKMFTFSKLLGKYKLEGKYIKFLNSVTLYISSANRNMLQSLFNFLMIKDSVTLLDNDLAIQGIKMHKVKLPDKERIKLKCLSPIVTYSTMIKGDGKKFTHYFRPHEKDFSRLIYENLKKKHLILNSVKSFDDDFSLEMPKFKPQVTKYKNYIIEGSYGDIFVKGERGLIETGIITGFGSKNSMGFGMCVPESILSRR